MTAQPIHPPASLMLKVNQQALQQRATEYRAGVPFVNNFPEMTRENLEALTECDLPEFANAAHMMLALYFTGESK